MASALAQALLRAASLLKQPDKVPLLLEEMAAAGVVADEATLELALSCVSRGGRVRDTAPTPFPFFFSASDRRPGN